MRATTQNREMTGALGINTKMTDRVSFAIACGISASRVPSYHYGSTSPSAGTNYIVDSFLVLVVGDSKPTGSFFISGAFLALFVLNPRILYDRFFSQSAALPHYFRGIDALHQGLFSDKVRT